MKYELYKEIRHYLAQIIEGTEWESHVYLVGGCVRDEIMQTPIHDIDIAVDLPNGGVLFAMWLYKHKLLAGRRTPLIFEHFGTAKVRLREYPQEVIDCVQTRKTKYVYEEIPHPEENFGTIEEDAGCRDLTINSLYLNISTNQLLDPTGRGLHDIEHGIIRTPNVPDVSLRDNAMHILRCIRFSVKYGWKLDKELIESMKRNVDILSEATVRRMTNELDAILQLKRKEHALKLIERVGAMPFVEPYFAILKEMKEAKRAWRKAKFQRPKNKRKDDKWDDKAKTSKKTEAKATKKTEAKATEKIEAKAVKKADKKPRRRPRNRRKKNNTSNEKAV